MGKGKPMKISKAVMAAVLVGVAQVSVAQASGIFIPPRPPAIKKPASPKCEPADSAKCKAEAAKSG